MKKSRVFFYMTGATVLFSTLIALVAGIIYHVNRKKTFKPRLDIFHKPSFLDPDTAQNAKFSAPEMKKFLQEVVFLMTTEYHILSLFKVKSEFLVPEEKNETIWELPRNALYFSAQVLSAGKNEKTEIKFKTQTNLVSKQVHAGDLVCGPTSPKLQVSCSGSPDMAFLVTYWSPDVTLRKDQRKTRWANWGFLKKLKVKKL